MDKFKARAIPAQEFHAKYPKPVMFVAQPAEFKVLTDPEDLREWERMLAQDVGLKAAARVKMADQIFAGNGTCCESGSPSNDCDED
jgi:hypothetical protein